MWRTPRAGWVRGAASMRGVPRQRLDAALVERGLFPSRARAQAAVMAGRVRVDGRGDVKPGLQVRDDAVFEVDRGPEFASRGGLKLDHALERFQLDVTGAHAIDVGASTGGFTDVLLRRGAESVIAVDVGYGQLAWSLREDPRVHVLDRTNARSLEPVMLPGLPDLAVMDVSFISSALVWPAVARCLAPAYRALVMVKPQFEVGRDNVGSGGVVRHPELRRDAVLRVVEAAHACGGHVAGACDSGTPGPKGNREIFVLIHGPALPAPAIDVDAVVHAAIAEGSEGAPAAGGGA
jgi:23S rRNA (cytidine1920-2'-O)/16S rRNA (cytidine1409-2'-O)-methyltransferase